MALAFIVYLALECVSAFYLIGCSIRVTRRVALCVTTYNVLLIVALCYWQTLSD